MSSSSRCLLYPVQPYISQSTSFYHSYQMKFCVFLISPVHFSCPICPTLFQLTTHHHSLTISPVPSVQLSFSSSPTTIHSPFLLWHLSHLRQLTTHHHSLTISPVPSVPLSFSSPPTTIHSPFLLSHLSHCLSAHHPPPFTHHFSCPICPTVFQLTKHHHSLTISLVPSVPLSVSSPPTTIHTLVEIMRPPLFVSVHPPANPSVFRRNISLSPYCSTIFQYLIVGTQTQSQTQ